MDFELTEDQVELERIAREVLERDCPPSLVRAVIDDGEDPSGVWKTLVELEWPGLAVPVEFGGSGATMVELGIVLEQLGWAADPSPFTATVSQFVPLVRECTDGAVRSELLAAACHGSPGAAILDPTGVTARRSGDGWVLDGTVKHVLDADRADQLAVVATTDEGVGVFVLPRASANVERQPTVDGAMHLATVRLVSVEVSADRAWVGTSVADGVARARDEALTGLSAVMVGASQRIFDLTLDHIKHRHQFGVPIGSFQAVKHMAVDMYVTIERARALHQFAALAIAEDDSRRRIAASMAKAAAGDAQRLVAQHGFQLFGALGYTWENDLQLYLRRAKSGDALLGSAHEHRLTLARITLEQQTEVSR